MSCEELSPGTLEHAIFEKLRRCGERRAHGQRIEHNGRKYDLTVNTISRIATVHIVAREVTGSPKRGIQRAMAVVNVYDNGYRGGIEGSQYVLKALLKGVRVPTGNSLHHSFVLPVVEVPNWMSAIASASTCAAVDCVSLATPQRQPAALANVEPMYDQCHPRADPRRLVAHPREPASRRMGQGGHGDQKRMP